MTTATRKTFATLFVLTLMCGLLGACNTVAGAGEDLSSAGHAVTKSADKVKNSN